MKTILKQLSLAVALMSILALGASAQHTLVSTTLSAAVTNSATSITVAACASTSCAVNSLVYVDREAMRITAVSGTTLTVTRGVDGTQATGHTSGEIAWVDQAFYFGLSPASSQNSSALPWGSCTSANEYVLPRVDTATGDIFRCTNSEWAREINTGGLKAKLDLHMLLDTTSDDRAVRINQRNYSTITSGSSIGFTSKPAQNVTTTGSVIGGEISPRINNTFTAANIIGLHVDAYVRGTTARTISGDVRGQQIELITDDAGTNTISGDVVGLRFRAAFSATTITGHMVPIKIEAAEAQTNSQAYDAVLKITGAQTDAWGSDTGSGDTEGGYLAVLTDFDGNGTFTKMYVVLYSDAP